MANLNGERMVKIKNKFGIDKIIPLSLAIKMRKQRDIEFWTELDEEGATTEKVVVTDTELKEAEAELDNALVDARKAYQEKFQKPVPNNKLNNTEWILEKLNETTNV